MACGITHTIACGKYCVEGFHFSAFINPRRACAARVTVVVSFVCYPKSHLSSHKRYYLHEGHKICAENALLQS